MREREKLHSEMFLQWINRKLDKNFIIIDCEIENSEIDVVLKEKISGDEILIQCVAYRGEGLIYKKPDSVSVPANLLSEKIPKIVFALVPAQYDKKGSIIDYIRKKEEKYEPSLVSKLVLLIEATIPTITPEDLDRYFPNGYDTKFRGIYFVQLPIPMINNDYKYDKDGFVYCLKNCKN
jgi:hypothetical protein